MAWWNVLLPVANAVAHVAVKLTGGMTEGDDPGATYTINDQFEWVRLKKSDQLLASNKGKKELQLSYTLNKGKSAVTVFQPLKPIAHYDATKDLQDFRDGGTITIAEATPDAETDAESTKRAINFAIRSLSLALSAHIVGGLYVQVGSKTDKSFFLKFTNDKPMKDWDVAVSATDVRNHTVNVTAKCKEPVEQPDAQHVWEVPLPQGFNPEPFLENLTLRFTDVPVAFYDEATAERHSLVISGLPEVGKPAL